MDQHEYTETMAGRAAALREVRADGWTLDTARAFLASAGEASERTPYGRGFNGFLRAWVDGSLSAVLMSEIG